MAQHVTLIGASGTIDPTACATLCTELRRGDGGVTSEAALPDGGAVVFNDGTWRCTLDRIEPDEILTCVSQQGAPSCVGGRRPQSLVAGGSRGADVAAWLAEVAHLEAASIPAFDELAVELALHRAPSRLSQLARASADDERRHARVVQALALRFGAQPATVRRGAAAPRSLSAVAVDNAVEGCAREAFGALVAAHQATAAVDPFVRAAFAGIARDEARHALLSFALDDWARDRVGANGRRRAEELRQEELRRMRSELTEPSVDRRIVLGLPDATRASDMLSVLAA
jgi:hypothetical protein